VVAETGGRKVGVVADEMEDVQQVVPGGVEHPRGADGLGGFVSGLARSDSGAMVILDLERLLSATDVPARAETVETGMAGNSG
jgi:chemotaxis signal transduction protein